MTAAAITERTEAQLLHALADQVRRRPLREFEEALHEVMHGETHDRWINLVAALGTDLHAAPINSYDHDELHVADGKADHPACYAERVRVWALIVGDPSLVAAALDQLADLEEAELREPHRACVGGRAYLALAGGAS